LVVVEGEQLIIESLFFYGYDACFFVKQEVMVLEEGWLWLEAG